MKDINLNSRDPQDLAVGSCLSWDGGGDDDQMMKLKYLLFSRSLRHILSFVTKTLD